MKYPDFNIEKLISVIIITKENGQYLQTGNSLSKKAWLYQSCFTLNYALKLYLQ